MRLVSGNWAWQRWGRVPCICQCSDTFSYFPTQTITPIWTLLASEYTLCVGVIWCQRCDIDYRTSKDILYPTFTGNIGCVWSSFVYRWWLPQLTLPHGEPIRVNLLEYIEGTTLAQLHVMYPAHRTAPLKPKQHHELLKKIRRFNENFSEHSLFYCLSNNNLQYVPARYIRNQCSSGHSVDLKPENTIITPSSSNQVVVIDFARAFLNTPLRMAGCVIECCRQYKDDVKK